MPLDEHGAPIPIYTPPEQTAPPDDVVVIAGLEGRVIALEAAVAEILAKLNVVPIQAP